MKTDNRKRAGVLVTMGALAMMALVTGCASQPTAPVDPSLQRNGIALNEVPGVPKWVWNLDEYTGGKKVLYGVGSGAAGIRNPSLRRKQADAEARADMAKTMGTYLADLQKSYQADTGMGGTSDKGDEQHVSNVMKQVTEQSLVGARIVEYYERPDMNHAFSLARLDIELVISMIEKVASSNGQFKQLDAKLRDWVRKNAEKANDQLSEELQKKNQK